MHLEFYATCATSFAIQSWLESDVEFVTAAEDVTDESWDAVGLTAGNYQYLVFGVNPRGQGPESGVATVPVLARAAA